MGTGLITTSSTDMELYTTLIIIYTAKHLEPLPQYIDQDTAEVDLCTYLQVAGNKTKYLYIGVSSTGLAHASLQLSTAYQPLPFPYCKGQKATQQYKHIPPFPSDVAVTCASSEQEHTYMMQDSIL